MTTVTTSFAAFRKSLRAAVAVVAVFAGSAGAQAVGQGDLTFYLDTGAFRGTRGRVLQDVYVRVANDQLRFEKRGGAMRSRVRLFVEVTHVDGTGVVSDTDVLEFEESAADDRANSPLAFQTAIKSFQLESGVYLLSVAMEDLQAKKRNLVGIVQGKNNVSAVRKLRLEVPEIPDGVPAVSRPMFVWRIEPGPGKPTYYPNPERLYGLYNDTLTVYAEVYLPDSLACDLRAVVVDAQGEALSDAGVSLFGAVGGAALDPGATRTYPVVIRQDLAEFPAGAYTLYFSLKVGEGSASRIRAGRFSVAWDMRTWETPRRDYLSEARFLLGDEAYAQFAASPIGDQERELDARWRELDPTPETDVNEAREAFRARLVYVYEHFTGDEGGVFSSRGLVYMRWGPPDEVIEDVIPINRETVSEVVQMVEDRFHPINYSTHGVKQYNRQTQSIIVDPRGISRVGEGGNVAFPFELWVYNGSGRPVLGRDRVRDPNIGMRYLFLDREGYGHYRLESSSSVSTK